MSAEVRTVLVSGAANGIGRAVAEHFTRQGDRVIGIDNDVDALTQTKHDLGPTFIAVQADLSHPLSISEAFDSEAIQQGVDVLICCAGIQRYGTVETTPLAVWDQLMAINLRSAFLLAQRCVDLMRQRGGGVIVNVASVQAFASQQNVAAYTASKGALVALTRAMALDHARDNIRVVSVCPGSVDTPMLQTAAAQFADGKPTSDVITSWGRSHPMGRVCSPNEVAELIWFLASPAAGFITGSSHNIDGGLLAALGVALPDL